MEPIIHFRQMMAEEKYPEVQRLIEAQLATEIEFRAELLSIYYEVLSHQDKKLPSEFLIELCEIEARKKNHDLVLKLLSEINKDEEEKHYLRIIKLKIHIAEEQGRMDDLYQYLSECIFRQYEKKVPSVPEWATRCIDKYFSQNFNLRLKELALTLLLRNLDTAERLTQNLILQCFEQSSPKGTLSKLILIAEVLKTDLSKNQLEIYRNFCTYYAQGISNKAELKRVVEMVIYFERFKIQVLVLDLLDKLGLSQIAGDYAVALKSNAFYSFVYLDKYFKNLKKYFIINEKKQGSSLEESVPAPDLKLESKIKSEKVLPESEAIEEEEEKKYINFIKYQNFSSDQLCDLIVSFLQSEMPSVALYASEEALKKSTDDKYFLKISYLKLICLLRLKDYRAALDTCLCALSKATSEADILSFMYGRAEIHIRLNEIEQAKLILRQILKIDENYRLTKERLDKLNEI